MFLSTSSSTVGGGSLKAWNPGKKRKMLSATSWVGSPRELPWSLNTYEMKIGKDYLLRDIAKETIDRDVKFCYCYYYCYSSSVTVTVTVTATQIVLLLLFLSGHCHRRCHCHRHYQFDFHHDQYHCQ